MLIERNRDVKTLRDYRGSRQILLVANGWHKHNPEEWPPNNLIVPIFIGFHVRLRFFPSVLTHIDYLREHEPIGCRDKYTTDLLSSHGVDAYCSNCLTTTFDRRPGGVEYKNIYFSTKGDKDKFRQLFPPHIRKQAQYLEHISFTKNHRINMLRARYLLHKYSKAKLVITTLLHCALPCSAIGVPVIVFWPSDEIRYSDQERMSTLEQMTRIYRFSEANDVDWEPEPVDIEDDKQRLIEDFNARISSVLERFDNNP